MGHCYSKDSVADSVVKNQTTAGSTAPNPPRTCTPSAANGINDRSNSNTSNHSFTGSPDCVPRRSSSHAVAGEDSQEDVQVALPSSVSSEADHVGDFETEGKRNDP
ncbi:hypothetical protein L1987_05278 [Smallanthus sonchifolius]|uniref:Uncharacterized protein n=1 Tax=Smallanthus sonchifolius TaxID=185202 RepID=A0ACB9JV87_9ASTR|nr:hypothetical protein L1987_05278 [Smallanthus sonchifolius]